MDLMKIERRKRLLDRVGGVAFAERTGLCALCGRRISDATIAHDLLADSICTGKPNRGWRYHGSVAVVGVWNPAEDYPHLAEMFSEMMAEARQAKATVRREVPPTRQGGGKRQ